MIKKFENFVNEGLFDDLWGAIDAGISVFKTNRNAQKQADYEMDKILKGKEGDIDPNTQVAVLLKQLMERSSWLADRILDNKVVISNRTHIYEIERIETILAKLREALEYVPNLDDSADF